jgi:putative phosphoesterase
VVTTLGVISDTHGLLRPAARAALGGVDRILHAGDIDDAQVLHSLASLAPVIAVRGNMDRGPWARELPAQATLSVDGVVIHVVHDVHQLDPEPGAEGFAVVISGHTHQPRNQVVGNVLYFNPGSAGPPRWGTPISLGRLHVAAGRAWGEILVLAGPVR